MARGDDGSRRTREEARSSCVRFSPTGREWAVCTTDGLLLYSLDDATAFDPSELDESVTPEATEVEWHNRTKDVRCFLVWSALFGTGFNSVVNWKWKRIRSLELDMESDSISGFGIGFGNGFDQWIWGLLLKEICLKLCFFCENVVGRLFPPLVRGKRFVRVSPEIRQSPEIDIF